jgi:N-acetylmuramoyl-L-alanine amidase
MKVVMFDPGHGGADSGCVNDDNLAPDLMHFEKDIALDIALQAAGIVNEPAFQGSEAMAAVLTRSNDVMVPLKERSRMTATQHIDLFVSIHHNAREPELPGIEIETYYWNQLTPEARSAKAATLVQNSLTNGIIFQAHKAVIDRGVKTANFHVLRETKCPAILTEVGFLTDYEEALWLNEAGNRRLVAELIVAGVVDYFEWVALRE